MCAIWLIRQVSLANDVLQGVPYLIYSDDGIEDIEKATSWWKGIARNVR
jgi:hypothetical protein